MRILLALLLCFVLVHTQAHALHASDTSGIPVDVVGTYAGVMLPGILGSEEEEDDDDDDGGAADEEAVIVNALALFSLAVPGTGLSTGAMLIFSEGRVFSGTINAFADPDDASIQGILDASYNFILSVSVPADLDDDGIVEPDEFEIEEIDVTATAVGQLAATVIQSFNPDFTLGLGRIIGTATMDISQGEVDNDLNPVIVSTLNFVVDGLKQTTEVIDAGGFTTTVDAGG